MPKQKHLIDAIQQLIQAIFKVLGYKEPIILYVCVSVLGAIEGVGLNPFLAFGIPAPNRFPGVVIYNE
ncbi:hypothetical protein HNV10_05675 [Winogradskyella litoriviva]|uniref:Uncharacterized protein n=1 Tax=Winogradskyella litoriviva TaxID=1220182 RepID=A0ABX2E389_9FLAO|nr:hypothetical protein [Winogradskyella litoriviva]NRD22719.1 hypothetical protein [Winogradskyella litoriviva]